MNLLHTYFVNMKRQVATFVAKLRRSSPVCFSGPQLVITITNISSKDHMLIGEFIQMRIKARLERVMSIFPPELKKNKLEETHPKIKMYVYIYIIIYLFFFPPQWLMPDPLL